LYWYAATLVRIVDGDTIVVDIDLGCNSWIKDEHVRLLGINTPEVRGVDKELGKDARDALASMLPSNAEMLIRTEKDKRGSFNRLLVDIYYQGEHINRRMVEDGFAETIET